jgi:hypothetical protein
MKVVQNKQNIYHDKRSKDYLFKVGDLFSWELRLLKEFVEFWRQRIWHLNSWEFEKDSKFTCKIALPMC